MFGPSAEFEAWAADQGVPLTGSPDSLVVVDGRLDEWWNAEVGPSLGNEVGAYLGNVLVENTVGAQWVAWPNGHPVVRLASGRELDVFEVVRQRLGGRGPRLAEVYGDAAETR